MRLECDVAIVGSGFSGSLMAMILHQLGCRVVLLERGSHPRFAIGESSTPLANLLWEELCSDHDLPQLLPFSKWGTWQAAHPEIGCGLKRGFTFFHHRLGQPFDRTSGRAHELLVAASPHDRIADTHWYRPDFDHHLFQQAQALGIPTYDRLSLNSMELSPDAVLLQGAREGSAFECRARFVLDATGPRGFLHQQLGLRDCPLPGLPPTEAIYSHFRGVAVWPDPVSGETPPYPPEQAAVHHLFPGGWIWVLQFNNGITSAGAALRQSVASELKAHEGESAWRRLLNQLPSVEALFKDAAAVQPFVHQPRLSFLSAEITGPRWALLPSAAGFVDPIFSTGFALTLLGIKRLAHLFATHQPGDPSFGDALELYADQTRKELCGTADFVGAAYDCLGAPEHFTALSLLYFAAASYSESARRLGLKPRASDGFFLSEMPEVRRGLQLFREARTANLSGEFTNGNFPEAVRKLIDPIDVAGLASPARAGWYPARAEDLIRARGKLGASEAEIRTMLQRCGAF
jgi:tetracycline 7-halogenase / FADH2 O2-dependent halogenase